MAGPNDAQNRSLLRRAATVLFMILMLAGATAGGWWWGHRTAPSGETTKEDPPGQMHLDKATDLLDDEEFDQALSELDLAEPYFREAEDLATIHRMRAAAYHGKGDYTRAIAEYHKAIEIKPKDTIALFNRGSSRLAAGQPDQALEDYSLALGIDPKFLDARQRRGELYTSVQPPRWKEAAEDFDYSTKLNPNLEWAWNMLARVHLKRAWDQSRLIEKRPGMNYTDPNYKKYEDTGVAMLRHFKDTGDPDTAGTIVWTCVLTDNRKVDKAQLLELAEIAGRSDNGDSLQVHGAALFRLGQYQEFKIKGAKSEELMAARRADALASYQAAIGKLTAALAVKDLKDSEKPWRYLFQCLTACRLANLDATGRFEFIRLAREALDKADAARAALGNTAGASNKGTTPASREDSQELDWATQLEWEILRSEAGNEVRHLPR